MIKFNELKIENCNKTLVIDASVINLPYYTDIYIESITIDTQDTYVGTGPSSTPLFNHVVPENQSLKTIRLNLDSTVLNAGFDTNLLFVYVSVKGVAAIDVPCGMDNVHTIGVVTNLYPIYKQSIKLLSSISDDCQNPQDLVSFILKLNALDLAIKTCNYVTAIKYWKKYFTGATLNNVLTNKCGCNG